MPHTPSFDLHIHAGAERDFTFEDLADRLAGENVSAIGVVDHLELYVDRKPVWAAEAWSWLAENDRLLYGDDTRGLLELLDDFAYFSELCKVPVRRGIETAGKDPIPREIAGKMDFVGLCIQDMGSAGPDWAEGLILQIERFAEAIEPLGVPGVIHHPFRPRLFALKKSAPAAPGEWRKALDGESLKRLAGRVVRSGLSLEINGMTAKSIAEEPGAIESLCGAYAAMKNMGVPFSLGSDRHGLEPAYSLHELARQAGLKRSNCPILKRLSVP